ncbi:MAG: hypothetical protein ACOH2M_30585 [Cypionkella sp.]|jgi:hypothetical protein
MQTPRQNRFAPMSAGAQSLQGLAPYFSTNAQLGGSFTLTCHAADMTALSWSKVFTRFHPLVKKTVLKPALVG